MDASTGRWRLVAIVAATALCQLAPAVGAQGDDASVTPLTDKTLVAWVAPANLTQRGGSVLTIDNQASAFDAIVFGEIAPGKWMPGSDVYRRTDREQSAWPAETASATEFVQVAIAYRGREIIVCRNGEVYARYEMPNPPMTFPATSAVLFGMRHLDVGNRRDSFVGMIRDARIYEGALDQETIAALKPNEEGGPAPWAWWSFADGRTAELTGRYPESRLIGDVRVRDGYLVLGGDGATMIAYPSVARTGPAWGPGESVPRAAIDYSRGLREHLLADRYRPGYHFVVPEDNGMPGDPNGALFWNGRYHLMYLFNDGHAPVWGHVSSQDLVHWRYHPLCLGVGEGDDGIFSGGAFVDRDGVATITYWGLGGTPARGVCIARSTDEQLDHWTKSPANPVIASTHMGYTVAHDAAGNEVVYGSADPSNIWMRDGHYYMLTGNLLVLNRYGKELGQVEHQGDTAYLFVSDDLEHWTYLHPFYQSDRKWTHAGEDDMCPVFLPLPPSPEGGPPSDKHLLLFISHCDGCQYYIGRYEGDRFQPETHGRMTWVDNAYFAPEALVDDRGRLVMWAWLLDNPPQEVISSQGWQGVYGLPRLLWLRDDGTLGMRPVDELAMLRGKPRVWGARTLDADSEFPLDGFSAELAELEITLAPGSAAQCGVKVCRSEDGREETLLYYDAAEKKLKVDTTRSSLGFGSKKVDGGPFDVAPGEPLVLRVFVDRSVVEVYANDRQGVARRVYPTLGGRGISLFAHGGPVEVTSIRAWELMPSNAF
jgi:beta-fructofuranosidase